MEVPAEGGQPARIEPRGAKGARPNIVVVMADDMRVNDVRFAPNLRRLVARRGLTFRNSFSPYPLCCPARASFFTGVYAHRHRVLSHKLPWGYQTFDDSRTLATSLAEVGYQTGFIGKYLNGYGTHDSLVSGEPSWQYVPQGWSDWRAAFTNRALPEVHGGTHHYRDTPYNVNGTVDNAYRGRYQPAVVGDFSRAMARRFSRSRRPFFMSVNYVTPHHGSPRELDDPGYVPDRNGRRTDYVTPGRPRWVRGRFDRLITHAAGLPRNGGPAERNVSDKPALLRKFPEPTARERRAMREVTRQRAEAVFAMDVQIGGLIDTLRRTGEWRRTVFMFTSDNGYFLGEHRRRQGKLLGHEPSLRVPFLVTGPGMRGDGRAGRMRSDPITTIDVSATIIDLAGAAPPLVPDGASKVRVMRRGDRGWRTPVLYEALHTGPSDPAPGFDDERTAIGVRTARYSMLVYRDGGELYDLVKDPLQNHSRWDDPAYREVKQTLRQVWRDLKDCAGQECRAALPRSLAAGAGANRRMTAAYWRRLDRVYGW
ncbi:sulfatase-like hydrolase/transferase [Nocardioides sp.]|uniref:sulfatase-like hydrolase/transferase n=1 Tax=Nocardioides sp. TaxID=35761 RepID=UPI002ED147EF